MPNSRDFQNAVKAYVENGSEDEKLALIALEREWDTLKYPTVVYRGQTNISGERDPSQMPLFSTTTDKDLARREFSDETGCVWAITLNPGVRVIDVNSVLGSKHTKAFEKELLVLGGEQMTFTVSKDPACTVAATYGGPKPETRNVTMKTLLERRDETEGPDPITTDPEEIKRDYMNPGEVFVGSSRRRKTRRKGGRKRRSTRYNASGRA